MTSPPCLADTRAIVFDLGNTLIADPREQIIRALAPRAVAALRRHLPKLTQKAFIRAWVDADSRINFPFASHFMQEESFVSAGLADLGLERQHRVLLAPKLLRDYRAHLRKHLRAEGRRSPLRRVLKALRDTGRPLIVFSDDRDWATESMLQWYGIAEFFEGWIFTSEGTGVEKTSSKVFDFLIDRIRAAVPDIRPGQCLYIGDHWRRDIDSPKRRGWLAVLYAALRTAQQTTAWRDYAEEGEHQPDAVVHTWDELLALLMGGPRL